MLTVLACELFSDTKAAGRVLPAERSVLGQRHTPVIPPSLWVAFGMNATRSLSLVHRPGGLLRVVRFAKGLSVVGIAAGRGEGFDFCRVGAEEYVRDWETIPRWMNVAIARSGARQGWGNVPCVVGAGRFRSAWPGRSPGRACPECATRKSRLPTQHGDRLQSLVSSGCKLPFGPVL